MEGVICLISLMEATALQRMILTCNVTCTSFDNKGGTSHLFCVQTMLLYQKLKKFQYQLTPPVCSTICLHNVSLVLCTTTAWRYSASYMQLVGGDRCQLQHNGHVINIHVVTTERVLIMHVGHVASSKTQPLECWCFTDHGILPSV